MRVAAAAADVAGEALVFSLGGLSKSLGLPHLKLGWMVGYPPPPDRQIRFDDGSHFRFPQSRWSFSHWRELMPSAEVSRGTGPVSALVRAEATYWGGEAIPGFFPSSSRTCR